MNKLFVTLIAVGLLSISAYAGKPDKQPENCPATNLACAEEICEDAFRFNVSLNFGPISVSFNVDCYKTGYGLVRSIDCTAGGKLVTSSNPTIYTMEDVIKFLEKEKGMETGTLKEVEILSSTVFTDLDGKQYQVETGSCPVIEGSDAGYLIPGRRIVYKIIPAN